MRGACSYPTGFLLILSRSMGGPNDSEKENGADQSARCTGTNPRSPSQATERRVSRVPDHWLNEKLRALYGPVLGEPIPHDIIELIEAHRRDKGNC